MIKAIEDSIIARLREQISEGEAGVLLYPERPDSYFVKHNIGEILVRFEGTKYAGGDAPQSFQNCDVSVELVFVFRRLRGKESGAVGLYEMVQTVRDCLYNYRLPQATQSMSGLQFASEDMLGESNGVWYYSLKMGFKAAFIPKTDNQTTANFITVKTVNNGCTTCS
jgi:hypothetical protein